MYRRFIAQTRIAKMLLENATPAALQRMKEDAQDQKQSVDEIAFRRAGNLLTSYVTYKPGGYVEL